MKRCQRSFWPCCKSTFGQFAPRPLLLHCFESLLQSQISPSPLYLQENTRKKESHYPTAVIKMQTCLANHSFVLTFYVGVALSPLDELVLVELSVRRLKVKVWLKLKGCGLCAPYNNLTSVAIPRSTITCKEKKKKDSQQLKTNQNICLKFIKIRTALWSKSAIKPTLCFLINWKHLNINSVKDIFWILIFLILGFCRISHVNPPFSCHMHYKPEVQ